jgi:8-oxoguanine deaminase
VARLLLRGLRHVATFDDDERELSDADILVDSGTIVDVGPGLPADEVDRVIDGSGLLAIPGLVNAHQHLYQAAMRAIPGLERTLMSSWLAGIGRVSIAWWREGRFTDGFVSAIARAALLESLLGGVTTTADQHYFFPGGLPGGYVEATIEAALDLGVRLHASRGSITMGASTGGTADDILVERVDDVLRHCQALIERYHDPEPRARIRVDIAPCGVHVDLPEMFVEAAALADHHPRVRLHTHLYERIDVDVCRRRYGTTPWRMMEQWGWATDRAWFAHMNRPMAEEIHEIAARGCGVVHLIAPDLRLGWGLAPVREYLEAGVTLGFGTTGSASNDGSNVLGDLRLAALAHRSGDPDPERWPTARELLRAATRGSAECLGREDLGVIAPGRAADIACFDLSTVDRVGIHDPLVGLLLAGLADSASLVIVNGDVLVEGGRPVHVDPAEVASRARTVIPTV